MVLRFVFFLLCFGCCSVLPVKAQTATVAGLPALLKKSRTDSILCIERMAALHFHQLINAYRTEQGVDTLHWNDTLWLTSRNHNLWMKSSGALSHSEETGTPNFTGESPGSRYSYVTNKKGTLGWSGENALYNYSANGATKRQIAENIAVESFSDWKSSPGHNRNMLAAGSAFHGVAFTITEGRLWGTDLFTYAPWWYTNLLAQKGATRRTAPSVVAKTTPVVVPTPTPVAKRTKFNSTNAQADLLQAVYTQAAVANSRSKQLEAAATQHAAYMAATRQLTHEQQKSRRNFSGRSARIRLRKATHGASLFGARRYEVIESIARITTPVEDFNAETLAAELIKQLDAERSKKGTATQTGFGIVLKRSKQEVTVFAVRLERMRKS